MPKADPSWARAFSDRFRSARIAAGLSQRALAERAGLRHEAIARIETGARAPNAAQAAAIAAALDAPHLTESVPDAETAERLRRERVSAGKKGKPRPDAAARLLAAHAQTRREAEDLKGEEELDARDVAAGWSIGRHTVHAHYVHRRALDHVDVVVGPLRLKRRFFRRSDVEAFQHTPRGTNPESLRALFSTHVGPIRQRALGKVLGRQYGYLGAPKPAYGEAEIREVHRLKNERGLSIREIAAYTQLASDWSYGKLSKRQVERILKLSPDPF